MRNECMYTIRNAVLHANVSDRSAASAPTKMRIVNIIVETLNKSGASTNRCVGLKTPAHLATVYGANGNCINISHILYVHFEAEPSSKKIPSHTH